MRLSGFQPAVISFNRSGAGLGNRIRAVLGAKILAEVESRRLLYVWPTGDEFGPRLTDLWDFPPPAIPRIVSRAIAPIWPYRDHTLTWLTDECRDDLIWQIRTAHALHLPANATPWEQELRTLRPVPAISDTVRSFFDNRLRGSTYVGVMIRAHQRSHAKTLETSPVDWFVTQMHQIREENPDIRFFLSCDVPEVAAQVSRAVPGTVTQADKGDYNSVAGVQAAVADLYLLASSGYLLGPHWSSFVEIAEILAHGNVGCRTPVESRGPTKVRSGAATDPLTPWVREP